MVSFNVSAAARVAVSVSSLVVFSALTACSSTSGTGSTDTAPYNTVNKVNNFLDGKTLTMKGANIPADPNGYSADVNLGSATQCYNSVVLSPTSTKWAVATTLGTLNGAASTGDTGTCDTTTPGMMLSYDSTAILVANVTETCFDFTATYVGFGQEGRGQIAADGSTVDLELYFSGQPTGDRCADGAVGAKTVTIKGTAFTGDAVQTYTIQ